MKLNFNLAVVMLILAMALCGTARAGDDSSREIFHAANVASNDYQEKIKDKELFPEHLYPIFSKIENYSIGISETDVYYVIVFLPKKTGNRMNGGGGEYLVRKSDFGIERFLGFK